MEHRRYLGQVNPAFIQAHTAKVIRVDEKGLAGYAAQVTIEKAHRPFIVGEKSAEVCLRDTGYSEINFLPDNENWCLSAMYDDKGRIIEWYVDITRKNAVDEDGQPYGDDMYLDAAVMPDGRVLVFDEDELLAARENHSITSGEYDMAYRVLHTLQDKQMLTISFMADLCAKLSLLF